MDRQETTHAAENETLFREVNEQVQGLSQTFEVADLMRIVCECGNAGCVEQIDVQPREYEQLRADPGLFAIKPGHELELVEDVVAQKDGYWVVKKALEDVRRAEASRRSGS